ncbi:MAG: hypothetical protein HOP16_15800 [Acidobacteria bacterium]|nr:hypothetical protein [Acidobacteriota bacterium]
MSGPRRSTLAIFIAAGVLFGLLATANGAGYRYGVSDQAFYIPVVERSLDSSLFPRDASLIDAQGHLMALDEILATLAIATGLPLEILYLWGYLLSLALVWAGIVLIGTRVYSSRWALVALGAVLTLRHRIPETSANSLEPYFHPRMLAFGLGLLAVAALLRRRSWMAVALVAVAAPVHVTTALWFAVLIGVALATLDVRMRRLGIVGGIVAAVLLATAAIAGPLSGTLTIMDDEWLQAVASKDSLFATAWPVWAWAANLGTFALLYWAQRTRRGRGQSTKEDEALLWGAAALVGVFLVTLPFVAARVALPVQFQISRVFWLIDFLATVYLIGAVADSPTRRTQAMAIAAVLVAFAIGRGSYVMLVERPERGLFDVRLVDSPWEDAMRWIRSQPRDVHVLADPGHAWKYGTSVRVAAERDVFLEEVKDSAIAIYSRDVAVRVVDRTRDIEDFSTLTDERALDLARRYDLDFLVSEADIPLPVLYSNRQFRIYDLR